MIIHPSSPPPPSQPPSWSRPFLIDSNLSISCIFCYESILLTDIILCCCIQPLECAILALTPAHLQELVETTFKTSQELRMLSSVTIDCQITKNVIDPGPGEVENRQVEPGGVGGEGEEEL